MYRLWCTFVLNSITPSYLKQYIWVFNGLNEQIDSTLGIWSISRTELGGRSSYCCTPSQWESRSDRVSSAWRLVCLLQMLKKMWIIKHQYWRVGGKRHFFLNHSLFLFIGTRITDTVVSFLITEEILAVDEILTCESGRRVDLRSINSFFSRFNKTHPTSSNRPWYFITEVYRPNARFHSSSS